MDKYNLQNALEEFNCTLINYTSAYILTWFFYSEERYEEFLTGIMCLQGNGAYSHDEVIKINKLDDSKLIVIQKDGVEIEKYKFVTLFEDVIKHKVVIDNKTRNRTIAFRIRKNLYGNKLNYFEESGVSLDFNSIEKIKEYLNKRFGKHKIIDWDTINY